tara:strand:- start:2022 stop:3719 length:1698 start_codon:yes stop_codon:yes gene_type:complete
MNNNQKRLKELLNNLSDGKIRKLIGQKICDSIIQYSHMLGLENQINYVEILINRYGKDILIDLNNNVLKEIIWALDEKNTISLQSIFSEIEYETEDDFKEKLIDELSRKFKPSQPDFSHKLLDCIGLDPDTYLFESRNIIDTSPTQDPQFPLHDFQKNIKDRSLSLLLNPQKPNRHMIHMPTGSGKTKTTMEIICDFIRSKICLGGFDSSVKVLWFAHSSELCEQSFTSFEQTWNLRGDRSINSIKFYGKHDLIKQYNNQEDIIIFAGFAKMLRALTGGNEEIQSLLHRLMGKLDLVIIDEAHRSMASEWNKAVKYFADNTGTQMIGLTATPGRTTLEDTRLLAYFFDSKKICLVDDQGVEIEKPVKYLQKKEVLAEIDRIPIMTNYDIQISSEEFQRIKKFGNTQRLKGLLNDLSRSPARNKIIVREVKKQVDEGNKTLIFACSVEHCIIIQSLLSINNIESEVVISGTSSQQRESAIDKFKNQNLKVLINFGVLTTGFDAPRLNSIMITRPVFSIVLYSQMIGRALRGPKNNGNKLNNVLTLQDNVNLGEANDLFESFNEIWN